MPIRVLVADDHPLVRAALTEVFDAQPDMEVVGQADDGVQAIHLARTLRPDVITMDIRMPRLDGLSATRCIASDGLSCRVLMVTNQNVESYRRAAKKAGALGLVEKSSPKAELLGAVRAICQGDSLFGNAPLS